MSEDSEGTILGRITSGEADTTLNNSPLRISRRRQTESPSRISRLPRGAWLRLRTAGGLIFRSSETVVFDDGRLTYRSTPTAVYGMTIMARELTESQVNDLRTAVEQVNFEEQLQGLGRGRDAMGYELSLRTDRRTRILEAEQGLISPELGQVLMLLGQYVRIGADELNG